MTQTKHMTIGKYLIAIIVILFCAVNIISTISLSVVRNVQMITSVILFSLMLVYFNKNNITRKIEIGLMLYYTLILGYWGLGYSSASGGNYFLQITFFISIIAVVYFFFEMPTKVNQSLYYIILSIIVFQLIRDVLVGDRYQGYTLLELAELGSSVMATSFSTLSLIIFCISLVVVLNTSQKIIKIIHFVILALTFYYIIFCGQRGSVLMLMLFSVIYIFYERFFYKKSISLSFAFIGILFITIILFGDSITSILIQLSPNERLATRFEDLQSTFQQGATESSFSGRLTLEIVSIRSWLRNLFTFFFGIGDHRLEDLYGVQGFMMSGIGGHAEFIDSLARYGLVGTSIIAYLYYNICRYIYNLFDDIIIKNQIRAILIISVLIGFTKGLFFPEIGIGLFLMLPLSSIILNKKQNTL